MRSLDVVSDGITGLAGWLDDTLRLERQSLGEFLESRHRLLAASLEAQLRVASGLGAAGLPAPPGGTTEPPTRALVPRPELKVEQEEEEKAKELSSITPVESKSAEVQDVQGRQSVSSQKPTKPKTTQGPSDQVHFGRPTSVDEIIRHPAFELTFTMLIVLSALVAAAEVQHNGAQLGDRMGWFPGLQPVEEPPEDVSLHNESAFFKHIGFFFGFAFTGELVFKIIGQKLDFLCSAWNWFDSLVIGSWIWQEFVLTDGDLPLDPMCLRLVRMVRILRILRMLKVLGTMEAVGSLRLLIRSIQGSTSILVWTALMLTLVVSLMSLILNFLLMGFFEDSDVLTTSRQHVFVYFGTFSRSMLSMFEVTLGNWIPITRMLSDEVSEWYMFLFITYKLMIGFAVVKVVSGVFMHETFKIASNDDELMIMQRRRVAKLHKQKMSELFDEVDDSGDGHLTWPEFQDILQDERIKTWLAAMELDVQDARRLWDLLDDGDGTLTADELILGVRKLKGAARSIDMVTVMRELRALSRDVARLEDRAPKDLVPPPPLDVACVREALQPVMSCALTQLLMEIDRRAATAPGPQPAPHRHALQAGHSAGTLVQVPGSASSPSTEGGSLTALRQLEAPNGLVGQHAPAYSGYSQSAPVGPLQRWDGADLGSMSARSVGGRPCIPSPRDRPNAGNRVFNPVTVLTGGPRMHQGPNSVPLQQQRSGMIRSSAGRLTTGPAVVRPPPTSQPAFET